LAGGAADRHCAAASIAFGHGLAGPAAERSDAANGSAFPIDLAESAHAENDYSIKKQGFASKPRTLLFVVARP
jgi:hypothetical protein